MQLIIDIDGTLVDNSHRQHLIPEDVTRTENWEPFNRACLGDTPIINMVAQVKFFINHVKEIESKRYNITFLTSRTETTREPTVLQLLNIFGNDLFDDANLIMRPADVHLSPRNFKREVISELTKGMLLPIIIFDDDESVCDMVRKVYPYITVVQVPSKCATLK